MNTISEMSNEERSKKYPIFLVEYNPEWITTYEQEKIRIINLVGNQIEQIFHFGSTAIPGMSAKPTVDILVVLNKNSDVNEFFNVMINNGYLCTKAPDSTKKRKNCMNFIRPYEINGVESWKVYIHIRENDIPCPELLFCKYLCDNLDIAREYLNLKKTLCEKYQYDREKYLLEKNQFIEKYTHIAIMHYQECE
jgi:Uncharacterized conserved protein